MTLTQICTCSESGKGPRWHLSHCPIWQQWKAEQKRECNGCTMCCKLLGVIELEKPAGKQCQHCNPGVGCKIYEQRPQGCKEFACLWLQGLAPEEMKPDETKVVLDVRTDGTGIVMHCDPTSNWRGKRPVQEYINILLAKKIPLVIVEGEGRKFFG